MVVAMIAFNVDHGLKASKAMSSDDAWLRNEINPEASNSSYYSTRHKSLTLNGGRRSRDHRMMSYDD